jgi:hypothetical protein
MSARRDPRVPEEGVRLYEAFVPRGGEDKERSEGRWKKSEDDD